MIEILVTILFHKQNFEFIADSLGFVSSFDQNKPI